MAKQRVVIEISPTRLEVALLRGDAVAASRALRLNPSNYAEAWPGVLDTIQAQLNVMVTEVGGAGAQTTVLYSGPTATTGVFSCAESAGATGASKAAQLALAEAAGFSLESNPNDLERVTADKPVSGESAATPQVHTLGIADTEPTAQALAEWVTRAGLEPLALVPLDVPGTIAAVDAALRLSMNGTIALVLFAGEQGSALAAASAGRLRFIRQIGIGTESLVAALAREIRVGTDGRTVALDAEAAAKLVFAAGIPERSQVFDAERGITGDAILPLVQPILQRCVVDIKQSMRFGLEEKEREGATLHGIGPGARVPRLMKLITDQTGLVAGKAEESAEPTGNIATWVNGRAMRINLLPRGLRSQMTGRRVRRAMWVGVGVAIALVGADMVMTRMDLTQETQATSKLKGRLEAAKPATTIQDKLVGTQAGLATAKHHLSAKLDAVGEWDAAMVMISRQTPAAIRLSQMMLVFDGNKPTVRLVGHAPLSGQADSNAALKAYMDSLTATPIVRSCRLGATQRGEGDRGPVQNFEMTLVLVELPAQPRSPDPALSEAPDGTEGPR